MGRSPQRGHGALKFPCQPFGLIQTHRADAWELANHRPLLLARNRICVVIQQLIQSEEEKKEMRRQRRHFCISRQLKMMSFSYKNILYSFIYLLFSCNTLILNHLDIFTADFFPKLTIVFNCLQGALSYTHSLNMSPLWLKHLFNTAVFRNANCLALHCHTSNIFDRCEDGMTVRGVTLFDSRAQLYER